MHARTLARSLVRSLSDLGRSRSPSDRPRFGNVAGNVATPVREDTPNDLG